MPPDSSNLFEGEPEEHNFAESSFTEDDVGTDVSEFDLANTDTSNVENMSSMFDGAESFNQHNSRWCVEQINENQAVSTVLQAFLAKSKSNQGGENCAE